MRRIAFAILALLLGSPLALADGFPSIKDTLAPTTTSRPVSCYIGAFASGAFVRDQMQIVSISDLTMGSEAFGGGPQIGCDLSAGYLVVGVFADYTFQSSNTSNSLLGLTGTMPFGNEWAIGGRVGAYTNAAHHTLVYVSGGYAEAESQTMKMGPLALPFSGPHGGFVGGGIETVLAGTQAYGMGGLTGFAEYRHEGFDTRTATLASIIPTKLDTIEDKVMFGIRYRWQ